MSTNMSKIMAFPPRKDSSSSFKVVLPVSSLQISPNLEALLQHDELTRRGHSGGSPTTLYHTISHSSGFAVSLPPPPPRNTAKKAFNPENRVKELRRKKSVNVSSDSWPDALPAMNSPVGHSSPASSRSATPNPYINPTPIVPTINNTFDDREAGKSFSRSYLTSTHTIIGPISLLSIQNDRASSTEIVHSLARKSEPDIHKTLPDPPVLSSRSSPALHKVEKMFTKGRESLSILTSAAIPSSMKPKQDDHVDSRPHRTDLVELSANQSSLSGQFLPRTCCGETLTWL
ncbi:uncharacterized protein EDB91DRAFT_253249 [Suillus paluster]|uniref:uncharacterized protein n=1 Tax=Suillus paluster TaxID=48578 RepID=UPI001B85C874|nr:uncharacterized protein EDB91DRAFT_253249 [Suillus paluster]KAG1754801.1 hypothetical protein EDB91DRAFT_253249 [Suillus paluster]